MSEMIVADSHDSDLMGRTSAIDGEYAVIGANMADFGGANAGAAYVLKRNGAAWDLQQRLLAPDAVAGDQFGYSVSISGNNIIVGAWLNSPGTSSYHGGAAYIFRYNGSSWVFQQKLTASDTHGGDLFGCAVGISGNAAVIGAYYSSEVGYQRGKAYVFESNGTTWTQKQKIYGWGNFAPMWFGATVAISGTTIIAGSMDSEMGSSAGAVFVFRKTGATWEQWQKLVAPDGYALDQFSTSLAIDGNRIAVGAPWDDDVAQSSGSVYVFRNTGSTWVFEQKMIPGDPIFDTRMGYSVSISGSTIASGAIGANGVQGAVYLFQLNGSTWSQQAKLLAANGLPSDQLGYSVGVSGDFIVTAAPTHSGHAYHDGTAYVFGGASGLAGTGSDCNGNGIPDACDLMNGVLHDYNNNGIPDECEGPPPPPPACPADVDHNHFVNVDDLLIVLHSWGNCPATCPADVNHNGFVNTDDLLIVTNAFGACP